MTSIVQVIHPNTRDVCVRVLICTRHNNMQVFDICNVRGSYSELSFLPSEGLSLELSQLDLHEGASF